MAHPVRFLCYLLVCVDSVVMVPNPSFLIGMTYCAGYGAGKTNSNLRSSCIWL
jgi:hypothetical protein